MKRLILWLLFSQIFLSYVIAYQEQDLDALADTFRDDGELTKYDRKIINQLWKKYTSGAKLTILEDDTVYQYERWMNRNAKFSPSPVNTNWVAYSRFGPGGWQFVVEHKVKNGPIYQLTAIPNREAQPFFQWASKTLKIVWETGQSAKSNLGFYNHKKDKSQVLIQSPYKDFAPHFSPLEQFVLFLSNRDRKSPSDKSYALYAVNLSNLSEVLKLTIQKQFAAPIDGNSTIKFSDNDNFNIQLTDGTQISYKLSSLLSDARKKIKQTNKLQLEKILQEKERNKSKIKQKDYELTLETFEFKDSSLRLVKELQKVVLKDIATDSKDSKILMSLSYDQFKSNPGPTVLVGEKVAFFIKSNNSQMEIWQYEGYGREPSRVSPQGEDCFGMQIDESSGTFAFLLKRSNSFYLIAIDHPSGNVLNQFTITRPMLNHGVELIKILSRTKIYYKDRNGNWKLPNTASQGDKLDTPKKANANLALTFIAPHLPNINTFIKKGSTKSKISKLPQIEPSLEDQIKSLRVSIQWISSKQELEMVKAQYNQLHNQVTQKIKSMHNSESFSQRRLKIRWIESLNGIKALLENTKLLLEVE